MSFLLLLIIIIAVNDRAGAKTPLAGLFSALVVLITILFLLPVFKLLPKVVSSSIDYLSGHSILFYSIQFYSYLSIYPKYMLLI